MLPSLRGAARGRNDPLTITCQRNVLPLSDLWTTRASAPAAIALPQLATVAEYSAVVLCLPVPMCTDKQARH